MPTKVENGKSMQDLRPSRRDPRPVNHAACGKCKGTWFEEVRVARYDKNQFVVPGQAPGKTTDSLVLLRCARCQELHEPPLVASASPGYKLYTEMVTELDSKPAPAVTLQPSSQMEPK